MNTARNFESSGAFPPPDMDSALRAGYTRQREIMLDQLENDVSVGGLHWNTAKTSTIYLFKPFSCGTVNINSTGPLANP
ncbi:putative gmc oxidoreductase [Diaporthe ampelina]|uniref:Putative gmc oxidoreductase n=1 Tax=Diaporthe ampelina TaxID=1214573 RepID=A0A0G2FZR2_9PEZI|nr:putative gmc oxidoreductase [Diaporthe ampelina]